MSVFKKAERKKAKLRLGLTGPSGSGKTYSALLIAKGLGEKTAVIDSEKGSASLYADVFDFDVLELNPPYDPDKYVRALEEALKEGYKTVIMDSISHAWAGEGGLLNKKEQLDSRGGNSFSNWAKMTPIQERFVSKIVSADCHVIVTMRSKQDYILMENDKGKQAPKKVGLAPVQREGFEYELTTVFDVAMNHEVETSKDRTGIFVDKIFKITEDTGLRLKEWLNSESELKENIIIESPLLIKPEEIENIPFEKEESHIVKVTENEIKTVAPAQNESKKDMYFLAPESESITKEEKPIVNHAIQTNNFGDWKDYKLKFTFGAFKSGTTFEQLGKNDTESLVKYIRTWQLSNGKSHKQFDEFLDLANNYLESLK